jgi:Domain of unknown function (DUF4352)
MIQVGLVIVIVVIIISMAAAMYTYTQYKTNVISVNAGEPIVVGPVEYIIAFDGTHMGNKDTKPENNFVKIRISAKNMGQETTRISPGQFYLDDGKQKHKAVYGGFSKEDLSDGLLEPNKQAIWTTQFDVPYDEKKQYSITIHPSKQQSSVDIGLVCISNCLSQK